MRSLLLGHRGVRGNLENTMPIFRRALRYADGIEFDVRLTADGELVVHHDGGFWSGGAFHRVRDLSLGELRSLHPHGKLVPRVVDVFRAFRRPFFNADVKELESVEPLLELTERFNAIDRVVFSSENPGAVRLLLRECPDCMVGFSVVGYPSVAWIPRLQGLYSMHVPIDAVSYVGHGAFTALLRALRKRGLRIYLWNHGMDELYWVPRLIPLVHAVISDDPARLRKVFTGLDGKIWG